MENTPVSWTPTYNVVPAAEPTGTLYWVLGAQETAHIPEDHREDFTSKGSVRIPRGKEATYYLTGEKASTTTIEGNATVRVSQGAAESNDYIGNISDLLSSVYKFNRKSTRTTPPIISVEETVPRLHQVLNLVHTRNQTREWANGRGDVEGNPTTYKNIAQAFAKEHSDTVTATVYEGDELLRQGFRLHHAVGRGSANPPVFVNLFYRGNPDSKDVLAYVGKGVCFDTGGYNIKTTAGIKEMYLDKTGAMTVLASFQTIVKEKLKVNVSCSIGLVENFISANAYRPSDIITSRKGLTVEIGNTDAEGRLVLADCMHWTQENHKPHTLIELSTLTGAMIVALGSEMSGVYTNDKGVYEGLQRLGAIVHEPVWRMPVTKYHLKMITSKWADLTNSPGKSEAGSAQAAAFLQEFVEPGVKWAHIDIAGTSMVGGQCTGWGSRLLVEYARSLV